MAEQLVDAVKAKYGAVAESTLSSADAGVRAVAEAFGYSAEELRSIHWCAPHASVSPAAGKLSAARERENRDRALSQRGQPTAVKLSTANTTGGRIAGENPRRRANH